MKRIRKHLILTFLFFGTRALAAASVEPPRIDYAEAYGECTKAMHVGAEQALAKCEAPARAGITGAQYVMGALLTNRNSADDMTRGVEWLEKAVAGGSPAAAHHLASILMQRSDDASVSRGRSLFKSAACAGYPPALEELNAAGAAQQSLSCASSPDTDFAGDWSLAMKWDKTAPAKTVESYRVSIAGGTARVYAQSDGKWIEVKPGKFTMSQQDQSLTISVTDTGWDFDGKWIESWTIQLMRVSADEAAVAYLRTVNNPFLTSKFSWKTFATFAEGTATRIKRPAA